jgi:hypothetical protein
MNNSNFFSLNWKDFGKGLIVAIITAFVTMLCQALTATPVHLPTGAELKTDALYALAAGASYVLKNLFSNSAGEVLSKEPDTKLPYSARQ